MIDSLSNTLKWSDNYSVSVGSFMHIFSVIIICPLPCSFCIKYKLASLVTCIIMLLLQVAGLVQLRLTLADKLKDTISHLNTLQSRVLDDELIRWKREQQLQGNGAQFNSNLDTIQEWCESLAEIIWLNRQQIKEAERLKQKIGLEPPGVADILPNLSSQITQLLSSLVTR